MAILTLPPWVLKHKIAFFMGSFFFVELPRLTKACNEAAEAIQQFSDAFREIAPMDDWGLLDDDE